MDRGEEAAGERRGGWKIALSLPTWFHPSYLVDWAVTVVLLLLSHLVEAQTPYERAIPLDDPGIAFPFTQHERVPDDLLDRLTFTLPLVLVALWAIARRDGHDVHHGVLGIWASRNLIRITVEMLKNRVGRLRPDFLARCQYDMVAQRCTGEAWALIDGRKSFPSGHSASSFVGLGFLALYIAGKTRSFTLHAERDDSSYPLSEAGLARKTSRAAIRAVRLVILSILFRLFLTLLPLVLATWIAITRLEDHRHHPTDVMAGSLVGALGALLIYHVYYPNVFNSTTRDLSKPKDVYGPFLWRRGRTGVDEESPLLGQDREASV